MLQNNLKVFLVILLAVFHVHAFDQRPPRLIKQPPNNELLYKVAQQNESVRYLLIECEAEGEPAPRYNWQKNGKPFDWKAYGNRMTQQPGHGTLVITEPRDEDVGHYQCFAENEHGIATSNSAFVRKAELNAFRDELPKEVFANEGEPLTLTCQAPNGWPKPEVYWLIQYKNGGMQSISSARITVNPEGSLHFSNVTLDDKSDDFYYVCVAASGSRNEFKFGNRILLNVVRTEISPTQNQHEPILQYASQKNEEALRGKNVELFCIYGGTPLPQTVWSKNGGPIRWSDRITQRNYGKSLIIRDIVFDDVGTYTCDVSNGVSNAQTYSINLRVITTPYFIVQPQIQNLEVGKTVAFYCEAAGVPQPEVKWTHNGKPIHEAPSNLRMSVGVNNIIIRDVQKEDTGNFGCNATNSLGYAYKDFYLNVLAIL